MHPLGPALLGRKLASALRPALLSGVCSGPAPSSSPVFTQVREFPSIPETMTAELRSL